MATRYTNDPTRNASARSTHDPTAAQAVVAATAGFHSPFPFFLGDAGVQAVTSTDTSAGSGRWEKRRPIRIRRSDYVHQQEYAEAVKAAALLALDAIPLSRITETGAVTGGDELEDDEILLLALTRLLH